jgi:hypothetical protein
MDKRIVILLILAGAGWTAAELAGANLSVPGWDPRPLDPLSAREQQLAIDVALADGEVARLLRDERHQVIGAAHRVEDKDRLMAGERLADVMIYRYGSNDVVWPVVDLRTESVKDVTIQRFQPVLTLEEVLEAQPILLADERVSAHVQDAPGVSIRGVLRTTPEGTACAVDRCIEVAFLRDGTLVPGIWARFDLSRLAVDEVWTRFPEAGKEES